MVFATVCRGLPIRDVLRLRRGLERHSPEAIGHLLCLNDHYPEEHIADGVHWIPLLHDWPKHFSKVEMWRPDLEKHGRIIFLDLSVVVVGDISPLLRYQGEFCVVSDFFTGTPSQSIASFSPGAGRPYYDAMLVSPKTWLNATGAPNFHDQSLLNMVNRGGPIDYWPEGVISSFKIGGPMPGSCIVKFHGNPKPEATDWAAAQWRANESLPLLDASAPSDPAKQERMLRNAVPSRRSPKTNRSAQNLLFIGPGERNIDPGGYDASMTFIQREDGFILRTRGVSPNGDEDWYSGSCENVPLDATMFFAGLSGVTHQRIHAARMIEKADGNRSAYDFHFARGNESTPDIASALEIAAFVANDIITLDGMGRFGAAPYVKTLILGEWLTVSREEYEVARSFFTMLAKLSQVRQYVRRFAVSTDCLIAKVFRMKEMLSA